MIEVFDLYQNEHKTYFINHYFQRGVEQWQLVGLITRRSQVQILPPLPKIEAKMPVLEVYIRRAFLTWLINS